MTTHKFTAEASVETVSSLIAGVSVTAIATPIIAALAAVVAIYEGYVIWVLWGWFAIPLGLPAITLAHAIGIDILISMFQPVRIQREDPPIGKYVIAAIVRPMLALAIGYVALQFI